MNGLGVHLHEDLLHGEPSRWPEHGEGVTAVDELLDPHTGRTGGARP